MESSVDVVKLCNQPHAVDADVDAHAGLAVPVEVGRLRHVGHVVGRLEVASAVKVLDNGVSTPTDGTLLLTMSSTSSPIKDQSSR